MLFPCSSILILAHQAIAAAVAPAATEQLAVPAAIPTGDDVQRSIDRVPWQASPVFEQPAVGEAMAGTRITSSFGSRVDPINGSVRFHRGVDFAARAGAPVMASADGVVHLSGREGGYGEVVEIYHGDGLETRYGHLSKRLVRSGEPVRRGQVIGLAGATGRATGPHVHWEVRRGQIAVDPTRPMIVDARAVPVPEPRAAPVPRWGGWSETTKALPFAGE